MAIDTEFADLSSLKELSITQWVIIGGLLLLAQKIAHPFLFSPVRHIPGPWWARLSKIPLQYATFMRRRSAYASNLIQKYGSIVVIAPDQVHTNDDAAMKTIYDRTSIKTSFYREMGSWKGITSTLGFLDYASAAPTRNNLIRCFQNKNLAILVKNINFHVEAFLELVQRSVNKNEALDGVVVFRLLALDIVTDVLWGEENTLLSDVSDKTPDLLRRFHAFSTWNAMKSFIPGADLFVRYFGSQKWKQLRDDCSDMDVTAREALHRWENTPDEARRERDVLSMLQAMNSAEDPKKRVPNHHLPAYMVEMLAAGSSTTSHTAAFACFLLTRNESTQERLQEELRNAFPDSNEMDMKLTMDLDFLDAVIRETMRMYPMIPGPLERFLGQDIIVAGRTVPKGVVASTAAIDQGRLPDVFPEPDLWKPERWLGANDRMRLNWTPFGHGSRVCPGSNLAITELKYMIGALFRRYKAVLPPGHESDALALSDVFAAGSKTGHVWLKFESIVDSTE